MVIVIILVLLTYLESRHIIKNGMMYGFILITTLLCIHYDYDYDYDYGNDYMPYYDRFKVEDITPFSLNVLTNSSVHYDSGWVLLK